MTEGRTAAEWLRVPGLDRELGPNSGFSLRVCVRARAYMHVPPLGKELLTSLNFTILNNTMSIIPISKGSL